MLRHEQQTVRIALATVWHHSSGKVHTTYGAPRSQTTATRAREGEVHEKHDGLRAQKRPLPGTRPEPLAVVSEPQGPAATVGYVAAGAPLLAMSAPRLAGHHLQGRHCPPASRPQGAGGEGEEEGGGAGAGGAHLGFLGAHEDEEKEEKARRCGQGFHSRSSLSGAPCSLGSSTGLRCPASLSVCTRRTSPRSSSILAVASARLVWLRCTSRYVPFWRRQAQDALHHGRYGPEGQYSSCARRQP